MTAEREATIRHASRRLEDYCLYVALLIAGVYGIAEVVIYTIVSLGLKPRVDAAFPWITVMFFVGCIIPKVLGRTTGGKIWITLAEGFAKRIAGKKVE